MSFNFSFTAPDKETAKAELCERNDADGNHLPEGMKRAVQGVIDNMPDPPEGNLFNVAVYGHFSPDTAETPGQSNITVAVQHVIA